MITVIETMTTLAGMKSLLVKRSKTLLRMFLSKPGTGTRTRKPSSSGLKKLRPLQLRCRKDIHKRCASGKNRSLSKLRRVSIKF